MNRWRWIMAIALSTVVVVIPAAANDFGLRLVSQTSSTITLGWDAQQGVAAYMFYADGKWVSHTFDGDRTSVTFAKVADCVSACYGVDDLVSDGVSSFPAATTPPTASFTMAPSPAVVGQLVTFDWTGTCPAGGCSMVWEDEGPDGPGGTDYPWGTTDPFARTFAAVGTKYAHLVVTDSLGRTAEARQQLIVSAGSPPPPPPPPPPPGSACDLNATPSTFSGQLGAATVGQTVCLSSGSYGTWGGTNKAITVRAADGATPQMRVSFGSGDSGFTLSGMTGMGGDIGGGANNITISNSTFTGILNISGSSTDAIVLDSNTHNWNVGPSSGANAKIYLENSLTGTLGVPSVTIRNSQIRNGDLDGVHFGGGSGYQILNNEFGNLCDQGANHTDNMQFDTSVTTQVRIAGNYVHAPLTGCETQGITSYDHGTNGVIIENNVVDIRRPWGIELYSDVNSVVRHNTVVYHAPAQCVFNIACGKIGIDRKSADPAGTGTQVYDNVAIVEFANGSTGTAHHNVSGQNAVYVGPLTFHDGFLLAPTSPVGVGAASDGTNAGVYPTGAP